MLLVHELAQPIVNKTMAIIKKNVNIMDANAIIIASGDASLLGVFHEGADAVIVSGKSAEVYPEEVGRLKGVIRPGVNLPITSDGRIIGVVGVSGHPDEIRSGAELVKVMVESMLEQIILREQLDLEARANDSFLSDLLAGNVGNREDLFLSRARILGYDISCPRFAVVMNIDSFRTVVARKFASQGDIGAELALQQLKDKVLSCIKKVSITGGESIAIFAGGDEFVALQSCADYSKEQQWRRNVNQSLEQLKSVVVDETGLTITIGVGTPGGNFRQYCRSFQEGRTAIKIGQCLQGPEKIFWIDEMQLANLVAALPEELLKSYVQYVLGNMLRKEPPKAREEMEKTLEALFNNALNPTKAARELFAHRNTVLFRLDKLYKETGYRPAESFEDAMELKIALLARKFLVSGKFKQEP